MVPLVLVISAAMMACDPDDPVARPDPIQDESIPLAVDPNVELLSIACRLAGFREYRQDNASPAYTQAVDAWFSKHASHEAVETLKGLRRSGISYDAPMSLAVHLTPLPALKERCDFNKTPARLDRRWRTAPTRDFVGKLRAFVTDTQFEKFLASQAPYYRSLEARMRNEIDKRSYRSWLDRFFGAKPAAVFSITPSALNGGANYGVSVVFRDGREEIRPVIGLSKWDSESLPLFAEHFVPTVVHEFVHSYTNPLVDAHAEALRESGEKIFQYCRGIMSNQAYGTWKIMIYESVVRACVIRYLDANDDAAVGKKQRKEEVTRGFVWVPELADFLDGYEADRRRHSDLSSFMPQIVSFFTAYAEKYDARMAKVPRVVSMTPANGDQAVDPAVAELIITFSRSMASGSYSFTGGGSGFPKAGRPTWNKEMTTITLPVTLEPNHSYSFGLNSRRHRGFKSQEGLTLDPVKVQFKTRSR